MHINVINHVCRWIVFIFYHDLGLPAFKPEAERHAPTREWSFSVVLQIIQHNHRMVELFFVNLHVGMEYKTVSAFAT